MSKIVLITLITSVFIFTTVPSLPGGDPCLHVDSEFLKSQLPIYQFEIISKRNLNGMCEVIVKMHNKLVPIYAGMNFAISGGMYQGRYKITEQILKKLYAEIFSKNIPVINKAVAFTYKPLKSGARTLYMFTDPLCPFCHESGLKVKKLADKYGIVLKTLLIAVRGKKSQEKCIEAVCRNFNISEYFSTKWRTIQTDGKYQCIKGKELLAIADKISDVLMVDGVPAFYLDDGTYISGSDLPVLEKLLNSKVTQ